MEHITEYTETTGRPTVQGPDNTEHIQRVVATDWLLSGESACSSLEMLFLIISADSECSMMRKFIEH